MHENTLASNGKLLIQYTYVSIVYVSDHAFIYCTSCNEVLTWVGGGGRGGEGGVEADIQVGHMGIELSLHYKIDYKWCILHIIIPHM